MMVAFLLLLFVGVIPTLAQAESQILIGYSGEYRFINIYGQSNGVPSYKGYVHTPEIQYAIANKRNSVRLYGNYGFGTLPNTANSNGGTVSETFKYRVWGMGLGFYREGFWFRAGLNYHNSIDVVGGAAAKEITFRGPGLEFGTGFKIRLGSLTELVGGLRLQLSKFSRESSPYFRGRRDYVSYAGFMGLNFIIPSNGIEIRN
jgi:hypothetical protein